MTMTTVRSIFSPKPSAPKAVTPAGWNHLLPPALEKPPDGRVQVHPRGLAWEYWALWHDLRGCVCPCTLLWCHSSCLCTPEDS